MNDHPGPTFSNEPPQELGYLAQPEMRELVHEALNLGWTLVAYEISRDSMRSTGADSLSMEATNHREFVQAENLVAAHREIGELPMIVWCGNSHNAKGTAGEWTPMGVRFTESAGFEPFSIDQTSTITFTEWGLPNIALPDDLRAILDAHGGTAGFVVDDAPRRFEIAGVFDALILSTDNEMIGDSPPPVGNGSAGEKRRQGGGDLRS